MSMMGRAVVIVGAPCAGKTSLATAFQDTVSEHYLRLGIDTVFEAVSERWAGGPMGPFRANGFEYVREPERHGRPVLRIAYGDVGWQVLKGMHDAVAAFVRAGTNVVFDDMPLDAAALLDWRRALADVPACAAFLDVPLDVAEQREQTRRERLHGLARGHVDLVTRIDDVDLRLDATLPIDHLASALVAHVPGIGTSTGNRLSLR